MLGEGGEVEFLPSACTLIQCGVHSYAQTHKLRLSVCHGDRQTLSIQRLSHWHLTSVCVSRQRPCSCHMNTLSVSTLRALFSGISEGRSVHRHCGQHSVCSSDFICLMCLGPLGPCSLVMRRTGLLWASC